jgi:hypothetical protein
MTNRKIRGVQFFWCYTSLFGWEPIGNPSWVLGTSSYPVRQPNWEDLPIWAGYPKPSLGSHYPKCSLKRGMMCSASSGIMTAKNREVSFISSKKVQSATMTQQPWYILRPNARGTCKNRKGSRISYLLLFQKQHFTESNLDGAGNCRMTDRTGILTVLMNSVDT